MKGDFTRFTFRPERHYSGVRLQQGRVTMDADFNEQVDIAAHRDRVAARALIGPAGAPDDAAGFAISGGSTLTIGAGCMYVDGVLAVNEAATGYEAQPQRPGVKLPATAGRYLAYLDVWERHVSALEQPDLRDTALGGPDTATRSQTVWQVRLEAAPGATCSAFGPGWRPTAPKRSGQLRAQGTPPPLTTSTCMVPEEGGYRRLENQLYRVEIVKAGAAGTAQFAWSRDNGSVVSTLEEVRDGDRTLVLADGGRDEVVGFTGHGFVAELTSEQRSFEGEPGVVVQVTTGEGNLLTLPSPSTDAPGFVGQPVRRWDGTGPVTAGAYTPLEGGVEVEFAAGDYAVGDYWTIPARTANGAVEWPRASGAAVFQTPHGVDHRYLPLAVVDRSSTGQWTVAGDCRPLFTPLAAHVRMTMAGGDGQEADGDAAGELLALAHPIEVAVMNGRRPVAGAQVRFTIEDGDGEVSGQPVLTDARGIASCRWRLRKGRQRHRVRAQLLDRAGAETDAPVFFNASFERGGGGAGVCTVALHEGDDLRDGFERLAEVGGGELCLSAGTFEIGDRIRVEKVHGITVTGRGPQTIITGGEARLLEFELCAGVTVRNLRLEAGSLGGSGEIEAALGFAGCGNVHVHDCEIVSPDEGRGEAACISVHGVRKGEDLTVLPTARLERNRLSVGAGGIGIRVTDPRVAAVTDNAIELADGGKRISSHLLDLAVKVIPGLLEEAIRVDTAARPPDREQAVPIGPASKLLTAGLPTLKHAFERSVAKDLRMADVSSALQAFSEALTEDKPGIDVDLTPSGSGLFLKDLLESERGREREVPDDVVHPDEATDRDAREKAIVEVARRLRVLDYGILVSGADVGVVELVGNTILGARCAIGVFADDADGQTTAHAVLVDRSTLMCNGSFQLKGAKPAAIWIRNAASATVSNTRAELRGGWAADPELARHHAHVAAIVIDGVAGSLAVVQRSTLGDWPTGVRIDISEDAPAGVRYVSEAAATRAFQAVDRRHGVEVERCVEVPG